MTLPQILAQRASEHPRACFLRTTAAELDYATADAEVDAYAAGLQAIGVVPGDRVLLLMHNSIEQVLIWLALNRIGAVSVPLNTALVGDLLVRSVRLVEPRAAIADASLAPRMNAALAAADCAGRPLFVNDASGLRALRSQIPPHPHTPDELAPAVLLFTSGSTGVSKACVLSHRYVLRQAQIHAKYLGFRPDDVLFTPFPLFHIDAATLTVGAALAAGATAAIGARFSASGWWDEVRATGATVFNFMGATANILWKQPPSARDREHAIRLAWGVPMPACEPQWEQRFGFRLVEVYGLTDAGVPAYQPLDEPRRPGSCGRIVPEYDVRIADAGGTACPVGTVGEIQIRSDEPGLLMTEYFAMPEATSSAFRDGWFCTGDLGRLDADGHLYFAGRGKEVIRRRGENIAATDIEEAVDRHPAVRESAAVGVPSELSEDDIKVFVVPQPGHTIEECAVVEHCAHALPRHMVPRYVEIVATVPKTPTEKIERVKLAALPVGPATWDTELGAHVGILPAPTLEEAR